MSDLVRKSDADAAIVKCKGNGATRQACRDAIAALPAVTHGIKPLVWFEAELPSRGGGKYTAEGYTIRKIEGLWLLDFAGEGRSKWRWTELDAAKTAAQTDYEQRIMAALEPVEAPAVTVGVKPWGYCPECGCEEPRFGKGPHKQCARCFQEWFTNIDYSEVVRCNLERLFRAALEPAAPDEAAKNRHAYKVGVAVGKASAAPDLTNPVTVHANMLRGTIAKPTVEQIIHLYGVDALAKALAPVIVREVEIDNDEDR